MSFLVSVPAIIVVMLILLIGTIVFALSRGKGTQEQPGTPVLQRKKKAG